MRFNNSKLQMIAALFSLLGVLLQTSAFAIAAEKEGEAQSKIKRLTQQSVIDLVLENSFEAKEINYRLRETEIKLDQAYASFDYTLNGKTNFEYDESEDLGGFSNPLDRTLIADLNLQKPTRWGTILEVGYQHTAQSSVLNPIVTSTRGTSIVLDHAYLQVRQPLWQNFFGVGSRLEIQAAKENLSQAEMQKVEDTEDLVLQALESFWKAYVAQTRLRDALSARERYTSLIKAVERRGRFGLDKGGEYAQVMADYWDSDRTVKQASYDYLAVINELSLIMQTEIESEIEFHIDEPIPALAELKEIDPTQLRKYQISELSVRAAQAQSSAIKSRTRPQLDLLFRSGATGVDAQADIAYSEFVSGNRPTYFIGLEFSTPINSSGHRAERAQAELDEAKAQLSKEKSIQEVQRELKELETLAAASFERAKASVEVEKFRSQTLREQENEYRRGRLTLKDLLQTYKSYFNAQSEKIQAIGDYQLTRNRLAAARDELVE